jgi:hypothetical protein
MRKQALRLFFGVFLSKLIRQSAGLEVITKTTSSTESALNLACASVNSFYLALSEGEQYEQI